MSTTLQALTLELSKMLTHTPESTATGGGNTTLTDTGTERAELSSHWLNGTLWFITGDNAGKSAKITAYTQSTTSTFTFATQASTISAGDRYAVADNTYPRWLLIQAINQAANRMRPPQQDTTLTVVDDQEEYTLPTGVYNVLTVEIATSLTTPLEYKQHYNWLEQGGKIRFIANRPTAAGATIRLGYLADHANIFSDTDTIDGTVDRTALLWKAKTAALRWRVEHTRGDEPDTIRMLNEAISESERHANRWDVAATQRAPLHTGW